MALISTPDERFADLPGYDYEPRYVSVGEPEMAYVDLDGDGTETFLCLHGEPTWGYLYRKLIPTLRERGRVVVPDFVGFGRSEKYTDRDAYSFDMHYRSLERFVEQLDLTGVTLVGQDWGGILGMRLATQHPGRVARLVVMNTDVTDGSQEMPETWHRFAEVVATADELDVGQVLQNSCVTDLSETVLAAYDAPFPDERYKAGARTFPGLVPLDPDDPGAAEMRETRAALAEWEKPAFVLFSREDVIFSGVRDSLRELLPTASDQPDVWIDGAGHFLQEDAGEAVAEEILAFVDRS
jgi:haloalkane dehalogenase